MFERRVPTVLILFPIMAALLLQYQAVAGTSKAPSGKAIFGKECWTCHANKDANMIDPDKTIAKSKKLQSLTSFKMFLSRGHGKMPSWTTIARNPRDLRALYLYVKNMKADVSGQQ